MGTSTMPTTNASFAPLICRRRRTQDRKAKAEGTRQKEPQSARDTKKARSKPTKSRTQRGTNDASMHFFSQTGAIWHIMHNVHQQGFTVGTTGTDGKWAEYFRTPSIVVKYAQRTSMPLFGSATVHVWPEPSKAKTIECLRHSACSVQSFVKDRTYAPSGQ